MAAEMAVPVMVAVVDMVEAEAVEADMEVGSTERETFDWSILVVCLLNGDI